MSLHRFSAFSFVDRISSIDKYGHISGFFRIPGHLDIFPQSLVAEAIGQLAAWYAMSTFNFSSRPVAALAGEIKYHSEVSPGERLNLFATIESCDNDSVIYSGVARAGERLVLELVDCTGVMLPQEEFDDANIVEEQYNLLETSGAKENRLAVAPYILGKDLHSDDRGTHEGQLIIPDQADFFSDHFPNKPVFPATLLIYALTSMVVKQMNNIASQYGHQKINISAIRRVKVRSWITPGNRISLRAVSLSTDGTPKQLKLTANLGNKLVTSALLELAVVGALNSK